jgi:hypothetical protein
MPIDDLISSGLLETYIMGAASPAEESLVQAHVHNPQIREMLSKLADVLELFARAQALEPPAFPGLKIGTAIE